MVDRTNSPILEPIMMKPSLTLILPLCVALAVACRSDGVGVEPQSQQQRVLNRLEVTPSSIGLFQGYTHQLTISAWDQYGAKMPEPVEGAWADKATFSSTAPEIAEVSSSGLVTGLAPGTAEITATLTLAGVTATASMTTSVWESDALAGVYELTAPITQDGWGLLYYLYTAVLMLRQDSSDPSQLVGTYEGLQRVGPDGPVGGSESGLARGSINLDGKVAILLYTRGTDPGFGYSWFARGVLDRGQIAGTWGCCDGIAGTFTAARR
jgi:hypothetical protein